MNKVGKGLIAIAALLVMALVMAGPASARDRNHDKIPDKWEKKYGLSLKVNQAKRDQDSDTLKNRVEFKLGTSPIDEDTDDDGIDDADENGGKIASFDGTTLTINLAGGGSLSGIVDDATEINGGNECGDDGDQATDDDPADVEDTSDDSATDDEDTSDDGGTVARSDGDSSGPGPSDPACTVDALVVGAVVSQAEYTTADDGTVTFTEIELGD